MPPRRSNSFRMDSSDAISNNPDGAFRVFAIDVDVDGDIDVMAANSDLIAWYENKGASGWDEHAISTEFYSPLSTFAIDLDRDGGDVDVVTVTGNEIAWYENNKSSVWARHTIDANVTTINCVFAIDVDGDGDIDVVSATYAAYSDEIAWYENNGSSGWARHTIAANRGSHSVFAIDVDGDGDVDVVSADSHTIVWYENNRTLVWDEHNINTRFGSFDVFAIDLDRDGDIDVVAAYHNMIAWFENDGDATSAWDEYELSGTMNTEGNGADSVFAIDVDRDGDIDVVSISYARGKLAWHENKGKSVWNEHTISANARGFRSVFAIDVDRDGDVDVVSGNTGGDTAVAWYENVVPLPPAPTATPEATPEATVAATLAPSSDDDDGLGVLEIAAISVGSVGALGVVTYVSTRPRGATSGVFTTRYAMM